MEIHEIVEAKFIENYIVDVIFDDLRQARIDLKKYLGNGIFKSLLNKKNFSQFRVDAELGTIVWPNGADIAPETLYQDAFQKK